MQTPFEILNVAENANDEAIKKAYLKKVKEFPPEHYVEEFQRVRVAFEQIQTEKQRRKYRLFHHEKPEFDALLRKALTPGAVQRPEYDVLVGVMAELPVEDLLKTLSATP
jgi:DnaJ-class molecular chaperone